MDELLAGMPVVVTFPVAFRDMDALGHVNNTQYLRWFEDGRLAYFGAVGILDKPPASTIGPILRSTSCRFRVPLAYPDTVHIGCEVVELEPWRFVQRYVVVSELHGKVAAEGEGELVAFDYATNQKAEWPESVRQRILELQPGLSG